MRAVLRFPKLLVAGEYLREIYAGFGEEESEETAAEKAGRDMGEQTQKDSDRDAYDAAG